MLVYQYHELVVLRDITFSSMCEHHLMPFEGKAHIAYIPGGKILGLSKLARIVDAFARRPQVQERMTSQIADLLRDRVSVRGCAVILEAVHTCMTCRGVRKPGSLMLTSAIRGVLHENEATRAGDAAAPPPDRVWRIGCAARSGFARGGPVSAGPARRP